MKKKKSLKIVKVKPVSKDELESLGLIRGSGSLVPEDGIDCVSEDCSGGTTTDTYEPNGTYSK